MLEGGIGTVGYEYVVGQGLDRFVARSWQVLGRLLNILHIFEF